MRNNLFVHEGNAIILRDAQNGNYVGIAFARLVKGVPEFATFSSRVTEQSPYEYCLLYIVESLTVGLREKGFNVTAPIPLRDSNRALITGDGEHYAIGVAGGKFHYACRDEGNVSDEMMALALSKKMRCPDRE